MYAPSIYGQQQVNPAAQLMFELQTEHRRSDAEARRVAEENRREMQFARLQNMF